MKREMKSILILLLLAIWVSPSHGQMKKLAQTGFQFLKIGLSARAEAMGGAYSMVGNDADAMFYNPAGLSQMDSRFGIAAHRVQWIADISYTAFGVVYKGNYGVFAVNFGDVDYGELIGTRVAPTEKGYIETGNIDVNAFFAGIAYARQLTDKFFIGGQVKYVSEHLGSNIISPAGTPDMIVENKASTYDLTFGTIYFTGLRSLRVGIYVRDFSEEIEYQKYGFQLPLTFRIGFAMDILNIYSADLESHSLEVAFDAVHPRDHSERINIGAEYWFQNMLALRAGYRFNHDVEGLTAGIGLKRDIGETSVRVDYSFSKNSYFDNVNRFSLGISF